MTDIPKLAPEEGKDAEWWLAEYAWEIQYHKDIHNEFVSKPVAERMKKKLMTFLESSGVRLHRVAYIIDAFIYEEECDVKTESDG